MADEVKRRGCIVLERREGERVALSIDGKSIGYVDISEIRGEKVRIAFCLDKQVRILREEIDNA